MLDFQGNDVITGNNNGVINAGGGSLNDLINMISDAVVSPANAGGDEDLYIQDDLELGDKAYKPGGGSWAVASDARLKQDITPYTDGLDKILQIEPINFKYSNRFACLDTGEEYVGILAQDMLEIAPYMVKLEAFGQTTEEDENGVEHIVNPGEEFYTYDSSALIYMLVNAVKNNNSRSCSNSNKPPSSNSRSMNS